MFVIIKIVHLKLSNLEKKAISGWIWNGMINLWGLHSCWTSVFDIRVSRYEYEILIIVLLSFLDRSIDNITDFNYKSNRTGLQTVELYPPLGAECNKMSIFKCNTTDLNSLADFRTKPIEPSLPYYLPIFERGKNWRIHTLQI